MLFSMVSLKVDNLTYRTTNRDLEYLFEKYGKVKELIKTKVPVVMCFA